MSLDTGELIDRRTLRRLTSEVGAGLPRIIAFFRDDGTQSVATIEAALAQGSAAVLVRPAHTLKGEALQFGAEPLGRLAERIEQEARDCVEQHRPPSSLTTIVPQLRPLFERTLVALSRELDAAGPASAPPGRTTFGRRTFGTAAR